MALETTDVADLSGLITQLLTTVDDGIRWFRGQGCELRPLVPSLIRKLVPYSAASLIAMESRLITRFRQRSLPFWPEGYPQTDWEHLFAMQHYGVPTRLLDWSESALMAAYFAADHDPARCECGRGACQPTLWVLDPIALNRRNSRLDGYGDAIAILATSDDAIESWAPGAEETRFAPWPVALYGTHNSDRIMAQQGTFTVWGKANDALESAPAVTDNAGVLKKIVLRTNHERVMRSLRLLGVSRAAVYRDLPSLSLDIAAMELPS